MQTKLLIKKLQDLVQAHEPYVEMLGEHELVMDVFKPVGDHKFEYKGLSSNLCLQNSMDGVYDIIVAEESWN